MTEGTSYKIEGRKEYTTYKAGYLQVNQLNSLVISLPSLGLSPEKVSSNTLTRTKKVHRYEVRGMREREKERERKRERVKL